MGTRGKAPRGAGLEASISDRKGGLGGDCVTAIARAPPKGEGHARGNGAIAQAISVIHPHTYLRRAGLFD